MSIQNRKVLKCGDPGKPGQRVDVIANDDADISMGTCSMTAERLQAVAFTDFFIVFRSSICSAEPKPVLNPLLIFSVFNLGTWLAIVAFVFVVGFSLWVVGEVMSLVEDSAKYPLQVHLFTVFKALVYQGSEEQPESLSGRTVAAVGCFVIITLFGVYSGNLTAWLSIPRYEKPVNSLQDLVERKDLIPYVSLNDPNHQLFMVSV
ncbi:ionotropic receptor 25a-like [Macrobrachium nipponense]|uniref:ionotropic receptor 25a-like n=1 Tax=Macrobrachium nipponense TaxID=159736 RepID=UPI0030C8C0A0